MQAGAKDLPPGAAVITLDLYGIDVDKFGKRTPDRFFETDFDVGDLMGLDLKAKGPAAVLNTAIDLRIDTPGIDPINAWCMRYPARGRGMVHHGGGLTGTVCRSGPQISGARFVQAGMFIPAGYPRTSRHAQAVLAAALLAPEPGAHAQTSAPLPQGREAGTAPYDPFARGQAAPAPPATEAEPAPPGFRITVPLCRTAEQAGDPLAKTA